MSEWKDFLKTKMVYPFHMLNNHKVWIFSNHHIWRALRLMFDWFTAEYKVFVEKMLQSKWVIPLYFMNFY